VENVHTQFGFPMPFCFQASSLHVRDRQTDRQTSR